MGHLVTDLGQSYITDFFGGAHFVHEGDLYRFLAMTYEGKLDTMKFQHGVLQKEYTRSRVQLDSSILEGFSKFSWPKLGYRNFRLQNDLIVSPHIQSIRSTRRGLSEECLNITMDQGTSLALAGGFDFVDTQTGIYHVFFPHWFTYKEALVLLKKNEAASVALNEDVSISHHVEATDDGAVYDINFRGRIVGGIMADGSILFKNKSISRMNMFKTLLQNRN